MVVFEKGIGPLLNEGKIFFLKGGTTKLLAAQGAIETLNKGLIILLVWASTPRAVRACLRNRSRCLWRMRYTVLRLNKMPSCFNRYTSFCHNSSDTRAVNSTPIVPHSCVSFEPSALSLILGIGEYTPQSRTTGSRSTTDTLSHGSPYFCRDFFHATLLLPQRIRDPNPRYTVHTDLRDLVVASHSQLYHGVAFLLRILRR